MIVNGTAQSSEGESFHFIGSVRALIDEKTALT
jgi:hypothetical protein